MGDKAQGAGLGLAIVKEMAEANHGRVELVGQDAGRRGGWCGWPNWGAVPSSAYTSEAPRTSRPKGCDGQAAKEEDVAT